MNTNNYNVIVTTMSMLPQNLQTMNAPSMHQVKIYKLVFLFPMYKNDILIFVHLYA
jgi:uncharacterized protein with PQ loop repeat